MKVESCNREKAERFLALSEKLTSADFTPEIGREVFVELEALRNSI